MTPGAAKAPGPADAATDQPPEEAAGQAAASHRPPSDEDQRHSGAGDECVDGGLAAALAQRDEYLEDLQRLKAEFDNYRKRIHREQEELRERAGERLVERLLGALDAHPGCAHRRRARRLDSAACHHPQVVEPLYAALRAPLSAEGLERLQPEGLAFDPSEHEAVSHEPDDEGDKAVVAEVLRPGYRWKGRLLRPAMVKVRG